MKNSCLSNQHHLREDAPNHLGLTGQKQYFEIGLRNQFWWHNSSMLPGELPLCLPLPTHLPPGMPSASPALPSPETPPFHYSPPTSVPETLGLVEISQHNSVLCTVKTGTTPCAGLFTGWHRHVLWHFCNIPTCSGIANGVQGHSSCTTQQALRG